MRCRVPSSRHPSPLLTALLSAMLVVLLALTAAGLGLARGQVRQAGMLVICHGDRVVTIPAPDGAPGQGRQVLCPDMAAGMLAALALPPAFTAPLRSASDLVRTAPPLAGALQLRLVPRARDPPRRAA